MTSRLDKFTDAAFAFEASENFSPLAYATLPFSIGLFVWLYHWGEEPAE